MNVVTWAIVTLVSFLGLDLLIGIWAVLPEDLEVPPGIQFIPRVTVFLTFKSICFIWGKTIFNCHFIIGILETDVLRTFLLVELGAGCFLNNWNESGNERALCCLSWMPRVPAAKRSLPLVSGYSSPRQNGIMCGQFPDPMYLDDVTACSVYWMFTLLLGICIVVAFFWWV